MIDESIILTFDGTIITGLFVFYAFFIILAKRLEDSGEEVQITNAIYYLALVQSTFSLSAIFILVGLSNWALGLTIFGLILLVVGFFLLVFTSLFVKRYPEDETELTRP